MKYDIVRREDEQCSVVDTHSFYLFHHVIHHSVHLCANTVNSLDGLLAVWFRFVPWLPPHTPLIEFAEEPEHLLPCKLSCRGRDRKGTGHFSINGFGNAVRLECTGPVRMVQCARCRKTHRQGELADIDLQPLVYFAQEIQGILIIAVCDVLHTTFPLHPV